MASKENFEDYVANTIQDEIIKFLKYPAKHYNCELEEYLVAHGTENTTSTGIIIDLFDNSDPDIPHIIRIYYNLETLSVIYIVRYRYDSNYPCSIPGNAFEVTKNVIDLIERLLMEWACKDTDNEEE